MPIWNLIVNYQRLILIQNIPNPQQKLRITGSTKLRKSTFLSLFLKLRTTIQSKIYLQFKEQYTLVLMIFQNLSPISSQQQSEQQSAAVSSQ